MIDADRLLTTLLDLLRIPSPSGQEQAHAQVLAARLAALGLAVMRDEAGNLYARAQGQGEPLLLTAHMDTVVPVVDANGVGVTPIVRDGVVYSAGETILGADDKAGVAIILEVLQALHDRGHRSHRPIEVLFTVGEEVGLLGAKAADLHWFRANIGIGLDAAGDPGMLIVDAPTQDRWRAVVHGRLAHAGANPEAGINAIQAAAKGIANMPLGRIDAETTANVGVIQGGRATNIVPDRVELIGEARSRDVHKLEMQIRAMSQALAEGVRPLGATAEIHTERMYEGYRLTEDTPIVKLVSQAMRSVGVEPLLMPTGGGSDSNVFIAKGLEVVQIGLGMCDVHTCEEHIAVADLVTTAKIMLACVNP